MSIMVLGAVIGLIVLVMATRWLENGAAGSHSRRGLDGRCAPSDLVPLVRVAHRAMSALGQKRTSLVAPHMSASLIGRLGSSAFRRSIVAISMSPHGLVLLFGIGTRALPSWGSRTRRNDLSVGLVIRVMAGPSRHAISPHSSSRKGHHATARWSSSISYRV